MSIKDITIVITSFKSEKKIRKCLNSIDKQCQVINVENSNDLDHKKNIEKDFNNVKCILAGENLGYGKANNIGLKEVKTKYALILNPDVELFPKTLEKFLEVAKQKPDFAIIGPNIFEDKKNYTYEAKYGVRDWKGGGRASARETVGRVAAGAIAQKILSKHNIEIVGYVKKVWNIVADVDSDHVTRADVETNEVRCPDVSVAKTMTERIKKARKDGDSLGGVVEVVARGVPPGLGEPVFDKLDALLARALLSLPACKGFEIGSYQVIRSSFRCGIRRVRRVRCFF